MSRIKNQTPAQEKVSDAIKSKMYYLINRVNEPMTFNEAKKLVANLHEVKGDSIWALTIQRVLDQGGDIEELIQGLRSQCIDDLFTMLSVLGQTTVILLLKSANEQNN